MRVRAGILVVVLAAALTACGGGDGDDEPSAGSTRLGTPGPSPTQTVIDCDEYSDTAQNIVEAQQELYGGSGASTDALDKLKREMDALRDGAPADVKAAIDEVDEAFTKARAVMADPSADAQKELAAMGTKLSEDGQKIAAYVLKQCKK